MLPLVSSVDAEAHRHPLGIELRDRLQLAVFVDEEVVLLQIAHEPPAIVSDRDRHADELDARAKRKPLTRRPLLRADPAAASHAAASARRRRGLQCLMPEPSACSSARRSAQRLTPMHCSPIRADLDSHGLSFRSSGPSGAGDDGG